MNKVLKIAITGPESTGKSQLAEELAMHYHTVFVPEFARAYIDALDRPYNRKDISIIAEGQLREEHRLFRVATRMLFCDTELMVTKIWSEVKYGKCDPWILQQIEGNKYDLFLLCNIDLPWENDPQREHPHMREKLFSLYFDELTERGFPFRVVSGTGEERLKNAIGHLEETIAMKNEK
ncbi:MAG: ATP-binding protein [Bacteroidetes bacterium]|nr:ATP-binding protein [Bacteroidota bacterium]